MGYTTQFEGQFKIDPPLPQEKIAEVNAFCESRHGGNTQEFDYAPSFHCDWIVSDSGESISWNGSEKSYDMVRWIEILREKFFRGHSLSGIINARGEEFRDIWSMIAEPGKPVQRVNGWRG